LTIGPSNGSVWGSPSRRKEANSKEVDLMFVRGILTCLAALAFAAAPFPAGADEGHEKLIQYYRKKANIAPALPITVKDVKDAPIPGAKMGVLQLGAPPRSQDVTFLSSADGRYVVFGEIDDTTVDPSKAVMQKIALENEAFKGPADATVTIVEYSDFQCPFCEKGYSIVEKEVMPGYPGKVKFYYKHLPLPFHPWAEPAAIAQECVKLQSADAGWDVYKGYFDKQKEITVANVKDKAVEFAGGKIDMDKFNKCYDGKETAAKVSAHKAEAASLGITGTPSFVINGRMLKGAQPADKFKAIIDDELAPPKT
jgi:protein-disulfide isomerase